LREVSVGVIKDLWLRTTNRSSDPATRYLWPKWWGRH